jgi:hypothetical protein
MIADGQEKEIFLDYGTFYEEVRKRKGYSTPPCGSMT